MSLHNRLGEKGSPVEDRTDGMGQDQGGSNPEAGVVCKPGEGPNLTEEKAQMQTQATAQAFGGCP